MPLITQPFKNFKQFLNITKSVFKSSKYADGKLKSTQKSQNYMIV